MTSIVEVDMLNWCGSDQHVLESVLPTAANFEISLHSYHSLHTISRYVLTREEYIIENSRPTTKPHHASPLALPSLKFKIRKRSSRPEELKTQRKRVTYRIVTETVVGKEIRQTKP
ncbi:hypothetical protein KC19_2G230100 [Ceratodon purpureus]|uniref:Uncharacterized protein n=1 Tax=Ceratodon purpureus TaxID=3225 RepID=A0A8T0IYG6_CERPU|nr:hypothetical protein KC19_2G230100 [Ceratodon purpureus]